MLKALMGRITPILSAILIALLTVAALVGVLFLFTLLLTTEPIGALPKSSEAGTLLGALLGAQAAIAALTLAVTLFVMQGVSTRRDADDRVYAEYIRRSWVRVIFWSSLSAVFVTGTVLMTETLVGDTGRTAQAMPGIPNLALVAAFALATNLAFAALLFERAIRLARPEHWRNLRQDVNKRDVRQAVQVYMGRLLRAIANRDADDPDWSIMFPDPGEGSANEAIRALLDDARRAMAERLQGEFESALNSIKELITYAMDEMEKVGMEWGHPSSQPEWPPLRELGRNLYPFREEVIREGSREYVFELLHFDNWLATNGVQRSCGEVFSTGLSGYRFNYQITTRLGGGEFHEMIRDRFSLNLDVLMFSQERSNLPPFLGEMIKHQERMLSDAMQANQPSDYEQLHIGFNSRFWDTLRYREFNEPLLQETGKLDNGLAQQYRIALMGLAGYAVILAESSTIADATPYLNITREVYARTGYLGDDIAAALMNERRFGFSLWHDWEMPDDTHGQAVTISPEKYPLTFFAVRLMELAEDAMLTLNLRGNAKYALDWFLANAEQLERFVRDTPAVRAQQRREFATEALREAVRRDEIEDDREIITREISPDRVDAFKSSVNEGMLASGFVKRLFKQVGTFVQFDDGAEDGPKERGFHQLVPKAFFIDTAEHDQSIYTPMGGEDWGRSLSRDAVHLLCEELEGRTQTTVHLDTMNTLLRTIDVAIEDLHPQGDVTIILAGDWHDILVDLHMKASEGYEPSWRLTDSDPVVDIGRYRGYPILQGPTNGERRGYVVDLSTWGIFVRAPLAEGRGLRVDVKSISTERSQELLQANPSLFSDQPDNESKIRKLQTCVEVGVGVRHGFRVIDPSRARRVTPSEQDNYSRSRRKPQVGGY